MNIVIVGGGTAGWLAALLIEKVWEQHNITLIESSKIGIIGAGEGSTGTFTSLIRGTLIDLGCSLEEFIAQTGATLKYGILHKNWNKTADKEYFGPLGGTLTATNFRDWQGLSAIAEDKDNVHLTTIEGVMWENNKSPYHPITKFEKNENVEHHYSFHFDAHKVGKYFKSKTKRVKDIDAVVEEVFLDNQGNIKELKLDNDQILKGDFFIDASGFARVLMNKLDNKWISYSKHLPVNSAMPFLLPNEEIIKPHTLAWAQKYGWMWQIPLLTRRGCGYVFCDDFTTPEKAQEEIETVLGHPIEPIKVLKFDTGKLEKIWHKNCLAIGLAGAFAEPLEATSIHSTIMQLIYFVYNGISQSSTTYVHNESIVSNYNYYINLLFENYRDFLNIHYMGGRTDTDFWRYMSSDEAKTEKTKLILDIAKHRSPNSKDFINLDGSAGYDIWFFVLAGLGIINPNICKEELKLCNFDYQIKDFEKYQLNLYSQNLPYDKFIERMQQKHNAYTLNS